MTAGAAARATSRPLRELTRILLEHPLRFAWISIAGIVRHGLDLAVPILLVLLIGRVLDGGQRDTSLLALLGAAVLGAAAAAWWQLYIGHDWAYRLLKQLRLHIYDGIARLAPARHGGKRTGELATTSRDDINTTELFFVHIVADAIGAALTALAATTVLVVVNPPLAGTGLIAAILTGLVPFLLSGRSEPRAAELRSQIGDSNAALVDSLQGLRELTLYRAQNAQLRILGERDERIAKLQLAHSRHTGLCAALVELATGGAVVIVIVLLSGAAAAAAAPVSLILVLFTLAIAPLAPIVGISETAAGIGAIREAARRVLALIHAPSLITDHGCETPAFSSAPALAFTDVRLDYGDGRGAALEALNFTIEPGETVALAGASGAGKTSIANLLLRFWDPTSGQITLDGIPLNQMPAEYIRSQVAAVPQDAHIFEGTIADNIRLGNPVATNEDIARAARQAMLDEFISGLPEGYGTVCEPGGENLSGGQRQRIAIARALLISAPILLLDEAVSNLDGENESHIATSLQELRTGRTIIVIAHRLSTIKTADRIILLDHGQVVATGTHNALLADQRYRDLLAI